MLLLGICDFGLGFWEQMQVANAARAGAEYAVKSGYNSGNIQTAVTNSTRLQRDPGEPGADPDLRLSRRRERYHDADRHAADMHRGVPNSSVSGTYVTVYAQISYSTIFAWPGISSPMTLASSVTVRLN